MRKGACRQELDLEDRDHNVGTLFSSELVCIGANSEFHWRGCSGCWSTRLELGLPTDWGTGAGTVAASAGLAGSEGLGPALRKCVLKIRRPFQTDFSVPRKPT